MTVEEQQQMKARNERGRNMVVGVKVCGCGNGNASKGLLTWALTKVATPGDHLIALHVASGKHARYCNGAFDASTFDVFESLSRLKKVSLQVKVSYGSSIKRVIVAEALDCKAYNLILGRGKHHSLGSSESLVKHFAKKLPSSCSILVVADGNIRHERNGKLNPITRLRSYQNFSKGVFPSDVVESKLRKIQSTGFLGSVSCSSKANTQVVQPVRMESLRSCFPLRPICNSCPNNGGRKSIEDNREELEKETSTSGSHSSFESFRTNSTTGQVSQKLASVSSSFNSREDASTLYNEVISETEDSAPGWPLMKCSSVLEKENKIPRSFERQMSVVEWALRLPDRRGFVSSLSSPISLGTDTSTENSPLLSPESSSESLLPEREESLRKNLEDVCENTSCRKYTYKELYYATSGFASDRVVGKGGWSRVYKGKLQDGRAVAVKSINPSPEADYELLLEVEMMTTLEHKNIVSLIGYCVEQRQCFLVYNLLARGSLDDNLHGNRSKIPLPWNERLKVAVGIADALDYLHDSCPQPIIHRDVKSSNILLDNDFTPQLSDFGLAKWAGNSSYITCPDVVGTFGYLAPEYFMYGKVNEKTDVYSFGVVLLELITGRKPISGDAKTQESLVMWARPLLLEGSVRRLADPRLEDNYDETELNRMVLAASFCLRQASKFRPPMKQISKLLKGETYDFNSLSRRAATASRDIDDLIEDEYGNFGGGDIQTYLTLAMLGVNDEVESPRGVSHAHGRTLDEYLNQRCADSSTSD